MVLILEHNNCYATSNMGLMSEQGHQHNIIRKSEQIDSNGRELISLQCHIYCMAFVCVLSSFIIY